MRRAPAILFTLAILALGGATGCHSMEPASGPLRVTPRAPKSAALGAAIPVSAELMNQGGHPLAILTVQVRASGVTLVDMRARDDFNGFRGAPGHATLTGDFEMEEIGPAARMPMPPRWEWEGDTAFVNPPVLAPGESLVITGTLRPLSYEDAQVSVDVHAALVTEGTELFTATGWKTQHVDDADMVGAPHGMGWTTKLQRIIALAPSDGTSSRSAQQLPAMPGAPLPDPAAALPLYPHFIAKATLERLPAVDVSRSQKFEIDAPPLTLSAARTRASIPTGTAIYVAGASAWWLDDARGGALVSTQEVARVAGGARALAERWASDGTARVTIILPEAEAKALVARFSGRTISTKTEVAKGGGVLVTVMPGAGDAFSFLDVLNANKLGLDGLRLVAATK